MSLSNSNPFYQGKSRADLETSLSPSDLALDSGPSTIEEASLYGVYFDDTEYDYMQHLRPVGMREDGFESVLLEAPKRRITSKKTSDLPISLHDLPPEALPSASELPRDFESQAAVQSSISGLQPDMDPHLRQTLEALEDDAYVDDDLDDDFFVTRASRLYMNSGKTACLPMATMPTGCTKGVMGTKQGGWLGSRHSKRSSKVAN
jgi:hypothetical protein